MEKREFGYCKISSRQQSLERQVKNIISRYPSARIIREPSTGNDFQEHAELDKLLKELHSGDTLIFDSVSRMSDDAETAFQMYENLFNKNINLVFLKEPHMNTDTYKNVLQYQIENTVRMMDSTLKGITQFLTLLAKEQIRLAYEQAEKEAYELRQRTREGMETARRNGKQIGQPKGATFVTKKSVTAKEIILKHNKSFGGTLDDAETIKQAGISRKTLYKYKKELREEGHKAEQS